MQECHVKPAFGEYREERRNDSLDLHPWPQAQEKSRSRHCRPASGGFVVLGEGQQYPVQRLLRAQVGVASDQDAWGCPPHTARSIQQELWQGLPSAPSDSCHFHEFHKDPRREGLCVPPLLTEGVGAQPVSCSRSSATAAEAGFDARSLRLQSRA